MTSTTSAQAAAKLAAKLFARTAAAVPRRAKARVAAGTQSPAKFMTAAWLTLAVAASVLLAVALPEPAPAAAQTPAASPYNLTVAPASGTDSAADLSVNYSLIRRNCDNMANPVADFTQASGTEVMENSQATGAKIHQLNWRCDWRVSVCGAPMDIVYGDGTKETQQPGVFWLSKDTTGERLVHGGYGKTVTRLEFGVEPFGCDTTELQVRSGQRNEHDISILRSGVFFVLVPVNCGTGTGGRQVSAAPVTVRDYSGILDSGEVGQYALDSRCGWRFYACDIPNTPSIQFYDLAGNRNVGSAASPTAMDVELRRHSSGKWGRGGSAFDFMVFNMPSVDIDNQPVAANLNRCPAAHAQATATVRVGRAAGVDTFAGLDYELAPVNCVFNDPATAPPPAQTNATTGTGGNTDTFKTHQLDARCDWLVRFCGSAVQVGNRASDGMVTEHATLAHGETFLLAKQLSNRALAYPGSAQSDKTANYFEVSEELGCADTEVQVAAATGVSAKAVLGVDYSLVPSACRNVNAGGVALTGGATLTLTTQTRLSGFPASGGALAHKLDVRCDWNIQFCTAGAKIGAATPGEGTPFGTIATAGEAFKLDGYLQRGFSGTVLRLQYEAATATGDRTKSVDRLWLTDPSAMACPKSASSVPSVALTPNATAAGNDTGSSATDGITSNKNPTFTVTGVAANSTVTVTATNGTDTVSRTYSGAEVSGTSLQVEFSDTDDECDTEDAGTTADESCDLTPDGAWTITATHTQSSNHDPANSAAPHTMVTIDTADPAITVAVAPTATAKPQADMRTVTVTSGGARNSETLSVVYLTQASSACATSVPATGTTAYMQAVEFDAAADGNQYFCAWVSDVAGNTVKSQVQIPPIDDVHPTVTIAAPNGATSVNVNQTVAIDFTLSDSTTSFAESHVSVANNGSGAALVANSFSGSGTSYRINLTTGANAGTATITVAANAFQDEAGNNNAETSLALSIQEGSSQPTLALKTGAGGSKTGSSTTATNDTTPTFTVSNVVAGASVTLTYEKASTAAVTTPATMVPANMTTVDITLPALAPADNWKVKATHTDGAKAPTDSAVFDLEVDTTLPNAITITPSPANGTATTSKTYTATDGNAETTTWVRQVLPAKADTTCDTTPPAAVTSSPTAYQAQSYTESATVTISKPAGYSDGDNGRTLCFWATDVAGNSRSQKIVLADLDTTGPTVTISTTATFRVGATGQVKFEFDETPTSFAEAHIDVSDTSKLELVANSLTRVGSTNVWNADFEGQAEGTGIVISLPANMVTDALSNDNPAPAGNKGSLTVSVGAQEASAAITSLLFAGDDSGASNTDKITDDNSPSFTVSPVVAGADVEVIAVKGNVTVTKSMEVGAGKTSETVTFSGSDCTEKTTPVGGGSAMTEENHACELGGGQWSFTATHTEDTKSKSTFTPAQPLRVTIDRTNPAISFMFMPDATAKPRARERSVTITVDETNPGDVVYLKQDNACPSSRPPSGTSAYVSGTTDLSYDSDDDSDDYICVWTTDKAGNDGSGSAQIPTIDTMDPQVTAVAVGAAKVLERKFSATDGDSDTTTWKSSNAFRAADDCPDDPPAGADDYTEGMDATLKTSDEDDNGKYICFWSTDGAGNTGKASVQVAGVDQSGPVVTISMGGARSTKINTTPTVTFTVDETTTDFVLGDIQVTNDPNTSPQVAEATLTNFTGSGTSYSATLNAGAKTGKVKLTVKTGVLTDALGNPNGASTGTDGANGQLEITITELDPSNPPTALSTNDDFVNTGSDDDTITSNNAPGFDVTPSLDSNSTFAVGTIIRITASKSGSSDTVTKRKTASANDVTNGYLALRFNLNDCTTSDGTDTETNQSCALGDGTWTFTATQENPGDSESSAFTPSPALSITFDTMAPPVTAELVSSGPTQEQKFRASTTETGTIAWKSASSFIASSVECATRPPSNADDYTPGTEADKTATDAADNGMKMCFWATDLADKVGVNFVLVAHVDSADPVVTVTSPDTTKAMSKVFSAIDGDDPGDTTWKYDVIEPTNPPTTACDDEPPADATSYTEGADVTVTDESANEGFVCFWSTDLAGRVGVGQSSKIDGIDGVSPTVEIMGPSSVVKDGMATYELVITDESPSFTGFGDVAADLTASSGTIGTPTLKSGSNNIYEATFTAGSMSGVSVTLTVPAAAFKDAAGNDNDGATKTISIVDVQPSQTPAVALADASDTGAKDGRYTSVDEPTFTVTFPNDATYMVTDSEVKVTARHSNGTDTVSKTVTNGSGASVDVAFTGTTGCDTSDDSDTDDDPCTLDPGDWKIKATHTDTGASHSEAESAEIDVTVITTAEAVTLTASSSALDVVSSTAGDIAGKTATLTFTVPASYAGPSDSALTVASIVTMTGSSGSLGAWSRSGNTYTATFTPSGLGTASFTVAANALQDLAGNNNPALASAVTIAVRVGPRPLILRNLADASNNSNRNYDLKVTPKTASSSCANAGARDTEYTLAAGAEVTIAVGQDSGQTADCDWTFEFAAQGSDCAVASWQFKESGHADDNASQGHGDTTKASPTEVLEVSTSGGILWGTATIAKAVFDVVCPTEFDATLEVDVTDPMSADHTGINIRVIVEATASQAAGCEVPSGSLGIDVSLGAAAANPHPTPVPGSLVDKLVDASSRMLAADADRCTYTARFPNFINGPGSPPAYRLVRTSAREVTFSNADDDSRKPTADYRVLRTAVLSLTNDTTTGHGSATTRRDVSVSVTPGSGCSEAAPVGSPFTVVAGASGATAVEIDFGTADCAWDLTFTNTADDCRVFAQRQEMYTGASIQSPVNNSDGALTVHVINRWVRTGPVTASENPELASIKFTVPDPADSTASPAGVCNTDLAGAMIEIEVDDSDSGTHTGTEFAVKVANGVRSDAGDPDKGTAPCSQNITDITLSLGAPTGAKSTVLRTVTGLIGTLHDGATCSYVVTFPSPVTSDGSDPASADDDDVPLELQGSATATLSASTKVSRTYQATRAATVLLHNGTGSLVAAHKLDNMEQVGLGWSLADSTCSTTSGGDTTLDDGMTSSPVVLGTQDCQWNFDFANGLHTDLLKNCRVTAQLQGVGPTYTALPGAANTKTTTQSADPNTNNNGSFSLWVRSNKVWNMATGGAEVGRVEFEVSDTCTTYFDGTVSLTVTDTMAATHTGGMIRVALAAPAGRSDCSTVSANVRLDIGTRALARDGGTPFTHTLENLIGTPLMTGSTACTYTATFTTPVMVGTGQAAVSFKLLEPTSGTATLSEEDTSTPKLEATAAAKYDAVRPARLALHNGTGPSDPAHVLDNMEQVGLNWILNDSRPTCAGGTAPLTLAAGASAPSPVSLGTDDCQWDFTFANGPATGLLKNCRVEAQLQGLGPNYTDLPGAENTKTTTSTTTPSTDNLGSFSLWVRGHRVFNQATDGAEVGRVEFEVTDSCTTYFPRAVSVSTTNAQGVIGTHTGAMIDVTVSQRDKPQSPRVACSAAAAGLTETITLDAAGSGQATFMNLVNKPLGQDDCEYEAAFETGVVSGSLRLNRTSNSPVDFDADTAAAATAVAATYRAVSSAGIKLKNVTLKTSTHPLTTMRDVVVTVTPTPSSTCTATAPSGSPFTLAAVAGQDEQDVSLGTQECVWTLTFSNRNSDCLATAQFRNASAGTEGSLQEPASLTGGSVTVNVDANRTTRIGSTIGSGAVVASIDFDVPTTACDTLFDAEVSLSVTDTANPTNPGVHAGTVFPVEVRQSGALARCSADQTGNDALMLTLKADGTAEEEFKLVNRPYGASADCRYSVSFPASRNSAVSGATVALVTTDTAGVLRAGAASVSAEYDAVRPATLDLENVTTASLTPASRGTVQVTLTPSLCSGAGTAPTTITRTLGAAGGSGATMEADLGTQNCTWTAAFQNPQRDCAISARLTDSSDADINSSRVTANNGAGSLVFYTQGRRARLTNTANGTVLSKAKFAVSATCATTFPGTVAVQVSDRNTQARHNGTAFSVTVAPVSASGCSPSQNLTVTLTQPLSGSVPVNNLVGTPLGGQACSYTVTYTDATKVSAVDSTIQLERPSAFTATIRDGNAQARTASLTYVAVRPAAVELRNTTPSSTVRLTPASSTSTCVASKTALFELTSAASSETVRLGTRSCFWTIGFANSGDDCKVESRLKNTSGGNISSTPITSKPNAGSITLHVSSDRRVMSAASGGTEVGSVEFAVTEDCDTSFDATVSISVTDTLDVSISDRNHADTGFDVTVSSSGAGCSAAVTRRVTLSAQNAATASFAGLLNTPAASSACVYAVGFPSSVDSLTNNRVRLVSSTTGSVTVSGASNATRTAALAYTAELIPEPVVIQAVSVSAAPAVTEGQPLLFPIGLPGPASQTVEVTYTVSGLPGTADAGGPSGAAGGPSGAASGTAGGTATINAGQSSGVISVPTEDDQRDSADLTVRVTLTGATGGVPIDQFGRTATGIVRDDDPAPTVGIKAAAAIGDELRFTLELSARSARDVRVSYTTSLGGRGTVVIDAGELEASAQRLFDPVQLSRGEGLLLRLTSAQNATIDTSARERLLSSAGGVAWRFHVTGRAGVTPAQIAAAFGLSAGWKLYSWDTQFQRWTPHTATAGGRAALPRGATITFRGAEPEEEQLDQAGLAPTSSVTLRRGWNIFTPAPDAIGLEAGDFTRTSAGNSAVIFDPRLIGCANLAGVLVIYTYDQSDPGAANGFRIALPCHPQVQASAGIPAIESIDSNDTIYAWFNSTTPATLAYRNGRYTPA